MVEKNKNKQLDNKTLENKHKRAKEWLEKKNDKSVTAKKIENETWKEIIKRKLDKILKSQK